MASPQVWDAYRALPSEAKFLLALPGELLRGDEPRPRMTDTLSEPRHMINDSPYLPAMLGDEVVVLSQTYPSRVGTSPSTSRVLQARRLCDADVSSLHSLSALRNSLT
jgi:hypothetical protein